MKNKIIISILAIFIIGGCLAAVYAESAQIGSFNFDVPSGYSISDSSNSKVVLDGPNNKEIIVTTDLVDKASITKYMEGEGFKFTTTSSGEATVYDSDGSTKGSYSYDAYSYSKGAESATAYVLNKNGVDFTVIYIDPSGNSGGFVMDLDVSESVQDIMFG